MRAPQSSPGARLHALPYVIALEALFLVEPLYLGGHGRFGPFGPGTLTFASFDAAEYLANALPSLPWATKDHKFWVRVNPALIKRNDIT